MATILPLTSYNAKIVIAEITSNGEYEIPLTATNKYIFTISKAKETNVSFFANLNTGGIPEYTAIDGIMTDGIAVIFKEKLSLKVSNIISGTKILIEGKIL